MDFDEGSGCTYDSGTMNYPRFSLLAFFVAGMGSVPVLQAAEAPSFKLDDLLAAAPLAAPEMENGYLKLGFEHLASYTFTPPPFDPLAAPNVKPPTGEEQIPSAVKSWNGKKVLITGYMVPVKMDKGLVTEFLLMRNTMSCCFGGVPNMNEWVIVKMKKGVQPLMDIPIAFYGELKVGAMFENGYMTGLYELEGEKMGDVQG